MSQYQIFVGLRGTDEFLKRKFLEMKKICFRFISNKCNVYEMEID